MNTKRFLLAAAIAMATAACSTDVTAPDPAVRAPAAGAVTEESPTAEPTPEVSNPQDDTGNVGSGCCAKTLSTP
jgi:hypothetical protein